MNNFSITHVALRVKDLHSCELFYRNVFGLEVAFREAETPNGWFTLPYSADWEDADRAGFEIGLVMLYRDGFRLALEAVKVVEPKGQLSHIGIYLDEAEKQRVRRAAGAECQIVVDSDRALVMDDPYGVRWELNTFAYDDPPSLSTGIRRGHWLEIEPRGDARR